MKLIFLGSFFVWYKSILWTANFSSSKKFFLETAWSIHIFTRVCSCKPKKFKFLLFFLNTEPRTLKKPLLKSHSVWIDYFYGISFFIKRFRTITNSYTKSDKFANTSISMQWLTYIVFEILQNWSSHGILLWLTCKIN